MLANEGVDEKQSLVNMSSSRDVLRQVEINNTAIARVAHHYANYRNALAHQLDQRKPEYLATLFQSGLNSFAATVAVDTLTAKVLRASDR